MWGKAKVAENLDDSFNINIIEESGDIEKDDGGNELALDRCLGVVYKAEGSVGGAVVIPGSELGVG